eukprot:scaffold7504_cov277-Pinguiococcus_pyrenoidosus.AAC.1
MSSSASLACSPSLCAFVSSSTVTSAKSAHSASVGGLASSSLAASLASARPYARCTAARSTGSLPRGGSLPAPHSVSVSTLVTAGTWRRGRGAGATKPKARLSRSATETNRSAFMAPSCTRLSLVAKARVRGPPREIDSFCGVCGAFPRWRGERDGC